MMGANSGEEISMSGSREHLVSCVKQFRMTTATRVVMRLMLSAILVMKKVFVSIPCK
jgi:hypothetical protein